MVFNGSIFDYFRGEVGWCWKYSKVWVILFPDLGYYKNCILKIWPHCNKEAHGGFGESLCKNYICKLFSPQNIKRLSAHRSWRLLAWGFLHLLFDFKHLLKKKIQRARVLWRGCYYLASKGNELKTVAKLPGLIILFLLNKITL